MNSLLIYTLFITSSLLFPFRIESSVTSYTSEEDIAELREEHSPVSAMDGERKTWKTVLFNLDTSSSIAIDPLEFEEKITTEGSLIGETLTNGATLLHATIKHFLLPHFKSLLKHSSDSLINKKDGEGRTPLFYLLEKHPHRIKISFEKHNLCREYSEAISTEMVRHLLRAGASPFLLPHEEHMSTLELACNEGLVNIAKLLLRWFKKKEEYPKFLELIKKTIHTLCKRTHFGRKHRIIQSLLSRYQKKLRKKLRLNESEVINLIESDEETSIIIPDRASPSLTTASLPENTTGALDSRPLPFTSLLTMATSSNIDEKRSTITSLDNPSFPGSSTDLPDRPLRRLAPVPLTTTTSRLTASAPLPFSFADSSSSIIETAPHIDPSLEAYYAHSLPEYTLLHKAAILHDYQLCYDSLREKTEHHKVNSTDSNGDTPLTALLKSYLYTSRDPLDENTQLFNREMTLLLTQLLLDHKADPCHYYTIYESPLYYATIAGMPRIVQILLWWKKEDDTVFISTQEVASLLRSLVIAEKTMTLPSGYQEAKALLQERIQNAPEKKATQSAALITNKKRSRNEA